MKLVLKRDLTVLLIPIDSIPSNVLVDHNSWGRWKVLWITTTIEYASKVLGFKLEVDRFNEEWIMVIFFQQLKTEIARQRVTISTTFRIRSSCPRPYVNLFNGLLIVRIIWVATLKYRGFDDKHFCWWLINPNFLITSRLYHVLM